MTVLGGGRLSATELLAQLQELGAFTALNVGDEVVLNGSGVATAWPSVIDGSRVAVPVSVNTHAGTVNHRGRRGISSSDYTAKALGDSTVISASTIWLVCSPTAIPVTTECTVVGGSDDKIPFYVYPATSGTEWFTGGGAAGWTHYRNGVASNEIAAGTDGGPAIYAAAYGSTVSQSYTIGGNAVAGSFSGWIGLLAAQSNVPTVGDIAAISKLIARYSRVDLTT